MPSNDIFQAACARIFAIISGVVSYFEETPGYRYYFDVYKYSIKYPTNFI